MVKLVPRGFTACADAYLTPHIARYLDTFVGGFDEHLMSDVKLCFMQSDGGLAPIDRFSGHRAILSGPAGGVVGYVLVCTGCVCMYGFIYVCMYLYIYVCIYLCIYVLKYI
jgi:N-methylhydantoinase A/oxoprolinase/acetone carboxylase beta subunit